MEDILCHGSGVDGSGHNRDLTLLYCCAVESQYFGSVIPKECLLLPSEIRKRVVNRPCKIFLFLVLSGSIGDLSISSFDFLGLEV